MVQKIVWILILGFSLTMSSMSYGQTFSKGDLVLAGGIGLSGNRFASLPILGHVEYGITPDIGVGGSIGFFKYANSSGIALGARGSYHFNRLLKIDDTVWDTYAGLTLILNGYSGLGVHVGGRYYFNESLGVFLETGFGHASLQGGVSFIF